MAYCTFSSSWQQLNSQNILCFIKRKVKKRSNSRLPTLTLLFCNVHIVQSHGRGYTSLFAGDFWHSKVQHDTAVRTHLCWCHHVAAPTVSDQLASGAMLWIAPVMLPGRENTHCQFVNVSCLFDLVIWNLTMISHQSTQLFGLKATWH